MLPDGAMANKPIHKLPPTTRWAFFERVRPKRLVSQIGYGYLIAISVGWVGSIVGILVADYFQGKGILQLLDAQAQTRLLIRFEETATQSQLQAMRSLMVGEASDEQQPISPAIDDNLAALSRLRAELDAFLAGQPVWLAQDAERLQMLLTTYEEALQQQHRQIRSAIANGAASETAAQILSAEATAVLDQLHQDLAAVIQMAQRQEALAADVMESAQGLEKFIVIASITVAGLLAGILAWRTTRAIATPIEDITQVARQVSHDANYQVRAQVFHEDEVGTLAHSLNELIERVAERTQALEQAAATAIAQNQELQATLQALKKAQLQLVQAEKMSSLGQLAAGIAHEINNPIAFIYGNLQHVREYSETLFEAIDRLQPAIPEPNELLSEILDAEELDFIRQDFPKVVQSIKNGTERINSLILSLKVFSRLQESHLKLANLNEGLDSSLVLVGHRLKSQNGRPAIGVSQQYANLPEIECFSSQMNQVFMNIINNAIDAIDERWRQSSGHWQPQLRLKSTLNSDSILIQIANNGLPIPPAVQNKIFDPFFTTKPIGKGVGLGLSVSYEIVHKKHQGDLTFVSPWQDEVGTQFQISMPL